MYPLWDVSEEAIAKANDSDYGLFSYVFGGDTGRCMAVAVVVPVTGWGQDGPQASRAGHDLTYQASRGMVARNAATDARRSARAQA